MVEYLPRMCKPRFNRHYCKNKINGEGGKERVTECMGHKSSSGKGAGYLGGNKGVKQEKESAAVGRRMTKKE